MKTFNILLVAFRLLPAILLDLILRPLNIFCFYFKRPIYYKITHLYAKFIAFCLRVKLSVINSNLIPSSDKKFLIVSNHQSYGDILFILNIFNCLFVQRAISPYPGFTWHCGKLSLIIDKNDPRSILKVISYIKKATVEQSMPVGLFPEGTRSKTGEIGDLNKGAAVIAKKLNLAVLPVVIYNSREVISKKVINFWARTYPVAIQPIIDEDFIKTHSADEITQEIKRVFINGLKQLENAAAGGKVT